MNNERLKKYPRLWVFFCVLFFWHGVSFAGEIRVAVASNFKYVLQKLAVDFNNKTGHDLRIIVASSGKLYAQIKHGAPFDVFLSADEQRPELLVEEGLAEPQSAYVYAQGKLVLLSNIEVIGECRDVLFSERLKKLAIANPKIAPYGVAAMQVLQKLGMQDQLQSRLVKGENIAQAFQFVTTKNADAGFVAAAMFEMDGNVERACVWQVPSDMYSPISQKMVVLKRSKNKAPVKAFVKYIRSPGAKKIIQAMGYDVVQQ